MSRPVIAAIAAFAAVVLPAVSIAMSLSPVVIDLRPGGRAATQTIVVQNTRDHPIPVEMRTEGIDLGLQGARGNGVTTDDLLVFPAQAMIQPGQSQTFRVQYVGEPGLARSRHYYVTAAQLPVQLGREQTGVQVLYNLQVLVSVAPRVGEADLKVVEAGVGRDAEGRPAPVVTVSNSSPVHGYLSRGRLTVVQRDSSGRETLRREFSGPEIQQTVGYGLVGGEGTRIFTLPMALPAEGGTLEARFHPEPRS
ncbi:fimbria/pilus periplasmic chaperone [Brevundimonas sp.]|uniref:fimbria/pilus periplasmic chaperone n=1 Tax=Brevundimonas sp. TaxID=1871086 RepID=UPI002D6D5FE5|nr:fimbria/pilus periplasmic chaperone [Brevundimonas sp.]HYD26482.1 fimbria/pilus periplasmic chaperone [Brevundimonas sp.]